MFSGDYKTDITESKGYIKEENIKKNRRLYYKYIEKYPEYISGHPIPKTLVGVTVHLSLIESYRNKEDGLEEAVLAASEKLFFKISSIEDTLNYYKLRNYMILDREQEKRLFDEKGFYKAGNLKLIGITEERYNSLSDNAKTWFTRGKGFLSKDPKKWDTKKFYIKIDKSWVKNSCSYEYIDYLYYTNWEEERKHEEYRKAIGYNGFMKIWHDKGYPKSEYSYTRKVDHKRDRKTLRNECFDIMKRFNPLEEDLIEDLDEDLIVA